MDLYSIALTWRSIYTVRSRQVNNSISHEQENHSGIKSKAIKNYEHLKMILYVSLWGDTCYNSICDSHLLPGQLMLKPHTPTLDDGIWRWNHFEILSSKWGQEWDLHTALVPLLEKGKTLHTYYVRITKGDSRRRLQLGNKTFNILISAFPTFSMNTSPLFKPPQRWHFWCSPETDNDSH